MTILSEGLLKDDNRALLMSGLATAGAAIDAQLGTRAINGPSAASLALTTTGAAAAGSRIFVVVEWYGAQTLTSVTGGGLTWTVDKTATDGTVNIGLASAVAAAGLASSSTITANFSAATGLGNIAAVSFTGLGSAAPEVTSSATHMGTTWNAGSLVTTSAKLVLGFCTDFANGSAGIQTAPATDFTELVDFGEAGQPSATYGVYRIVSAAASYTPGGTVSTSAGFQVAVGAAYA